MSITRHELRVKCRKGQVILNTKLKTAREKTGLTQVQVAEKAKITERSYQRIEKGAQDPKTKTSKLIAQALNSTVEELF